MNKLNVFIIALAILGTNAGAEAIKPNIEAVPNPVPFYSIVGSSDGEISLARDGEKATRFYQTTFGGVILKDASGTLSTQWLDAISPESKMLVLNKYAYYEIFKLYASDIVYNGSVDYVVHVKFTRNDDGRMRDIYVLGMMNFANGKRVQVTYSGIADADGNVTGNDIEVGLDTISKWLKTGNGNANRNAVNENKFTMREGGLPAVDVMDRINRILQFKYLSQPEMPQP